MGQASDTETGGTLRGICMVLMVSCLCVGGTTLKKGPGPPQERWTGTLLLTVVASERTSKKGRKELENYSIWKCKKDMYDKTRQIDCPGWKKETDQLKWICTSAGWTRTLKTVCMMSGHCKHIHFDCSYFSTLSKLGKTDAVQRLKVDIHGTQHFGSEVSKRQGVHKLPKGTKM